MDASAWPDFAAEPLERQVALFYLYRARARWIDGAGAHHCGQHGQAWFSARIAYEGALHATCALGGQTNPNAKWLPAKLHRLEADPEGHLERFWQLCAGLPPAGPTEETAAELLVATGRVLLGVTARFAGVANVTDHGATTPLVRLEVLPDGSGLVALDFRGKGQRVGEAAS